MGGNEFELEKTKLSEILKKYERLADFFDSKIKTIPNIYRNDPFMMKNMLEMYYERLNGIENNLTKPYFARIDYQPLGDEKTQQLYIGKVGVLDDENEIITLDWRAPIASVYYDSNIGEVEYDSPEGKSRGELKLKRQFEIENSQLQSYQDVDIVSNDEILKPYLGTNVDNRLKNIVSTIQKEQNEIIREKIRKNIIIQGVAGSGKTTVALHRIAYLVYNNKDVIKPEQYMVIGPSKFFVNYISGVLPDLDVNNVSQLTIEELCENALVQKINLRSSEENLIKSIEGVETLEYERFKVSLEFKECIDKYIKDLNEILLGNSNFEVKGYSILPSEKIRKEYYSIEDNKIYNSINKKLQRTQLQLEKYISENKKEILEKITTEYKIKVLKLNQQDKLKEENRFKLVQNELEKNCKSSLKKYFETKLPSVINLYYNFLLNLKYYLNPELRKYDINARENAKMIKNRKVEFEDISALIYLKCKVIGNDEFKNYIQIAIDEAQDYGEFTFYALKELFSNAYFSIFGDLAQSIYQYRGVRDWECVKDKTFNNNIEIKYLLKSYRTTTEIMNEANNIIKYININPAQPVIRHGKDVEYIKYVNIDEQIKIILDILKGYQCEMYKSIAVICKDEKEACYFNKVINENGIKIKNIVNSDTEYDGGICTITSYLAKGLEFDGAIIADASEEKYSSGRVIDMKLLYVNMTRPLHELKILYKDNLNKALK